VTTTAEVTGGVRPPAATGRFYAADPDRLRHDVVRHGQDAIATARDHDQGGNTVHLNRALAAT
jgi:hypothetical protein